MKTVKNLQHWYTLNLVNVKSPILVDHLAVRSWGF